MINSGEYQANTNDLVGDPQFAGIPMSGNAGDHKGSDLTLEDFVACRSEAIDTGTASGSVPAYDIVGEECVPTTCASLGHECGQPSDGCGSALSCGACGIGQTCSSGVCIDSPVPTPPPSGQGERPWADNTGPSNPELLSAANAPPDPIMTDGATYENFIWTGGNSQH